MKMTKMERNKRIKRHLGSLGIIGVVCFMFLVVLYTGLQMRAQNMEKQAYIQELESQIADEEEHALEIEEYEKYVQTKKCAEEIAKEKLGLVYEDEIIFKAEE